MNRLLYMTILVQCGVTYAWGHMNCDDKYLAPYHKKLSMLQEQIKEINVSNESIFMFR